MAKYQLNPIKINKRPTKMKFGSRKLSDLGRQILRLDSFNDYLQYSLLSSTLLLDFGVYVLITKLSSLSRSFLYFVCFLLVSAPNFFHLFQHFQQSLAVSPDKDLTLNCWIVGLSWKLLQCLCIEIAGNV